MIRRPPRSTPLYSSAASDVYKRQVLETTQFDQDDEYLGGKRLPVTTSVYDLSLIHISEPTRLRRISYAVFCLKKKKKKTKKTELKLDNRKKKKNIPTILN